MKTRTLIVAAMLAGSLAGTAQATTAAKNVPFEVVSYAGPAAAAVLAGSLVVETLFGLPGMGRHLVQGALNRDYTLVMGMVIVYAALMIALNLVADLLYAWLDPRIRQERRR